MRLFYIAVVSGALALPSLAHAQSKKVEGASLAGLCAASLEFVAGARNAAGAAQPQELLVLQRTRDQYLAIPSFQPAEVEGYANAWSQRMSENLMQSADNASRGAVAKDIGRIAQECQQKMFERLRAAQQGQVPAAPSVSPQPVPAQPSTTITIQ